MEWAKCGGCRRTWVEDLFSGDKLLEYAFSYNSLLEAMTCLVNFDTFEHLI